jgi:hypothetical protein
MPSLHTISLPINGSCIVIKNAILADGITDVVTVVAVAGVAAGWGAIAPLGTIGLTPALGTAGTTRPDLDTTAPLGKIGDGGMVAVPPSVAAVGTAVVAPVNNLGNEGMAGTPLPTFGIANGVVVGIVFEVDGDDGDGVGAAPPTAATINDDKSHTMVTNPATNAIIVHPFLAARRIGGGIRNKRP